MTRDILLISHMLGLGLGLGTSFAHMFLGIAASKMEADKSLALQKAIVRPLGLMGDIGLGLLILSGIALAYDYGSALMQMPLFHIKILLVIVLIVVLIPLKKLSKLVAQGDAAAIAKSEKLGKITLPLSLAIVVLAVLAFH